MGRKTLEKQIQTLDEQLAIELALLKLEGRERCNSLQRVPPLYWLAASLVGGLLAGKLVGQNGPGLLITQGGNMFRVASLFMPSLTRLAPTVTV